MDNESYSCREPLQSEEVYELEVERVQERRRKDYQSLKAVAGYIQAILDCYHRLSIKHITYVLYEIVSKTALGTEIANIRLKSKDEGAQEELKARNIYELENKYDDIESSNDFFMIRNLKRRLYDVLNVLIASGIVVRHTKTLSLSSHFSNMIPIMGPSSAQNKQYRLKLQSEITQKAKNIAKKKKMVTSQAKSVLFSQKLLARNIEKNAQHQSMSKMMLPIVIIVCQPTPVLDLQGTTFELRASEEIEMLGDLEVFQHLFKVRKYEIDQFLKKLPIK